MAKIKQLKDKSGTEQIFPKTKTEAIYNTDGTLLSETLDNLYGSLATIESSPATTNHSVGEYILYEGQLYKVIAAILSGETLVAGTNISAVSVGDEVKTLNSNLNAITQESWEPHALDINTDKGLLRSYLASGSSMSANLYKIGKWRIAFISLSNPGVSLSSFNTMFNVGEFPFHILAAGVFIASDPTRTAQVEFTNNFIYIRPNMLNGTFSSNTTGVFRVWAVGYAD